MTGPDRRSPPAVQLAAILLVATLATGAALLARTCGTRPAGDDHPNPTAEGLDADPLTRTEPDRRPAAGDHRNAAGGIVRRPTAGADGSRSEADVAETAASTGHTPAEGAKCDDGDPCTLADRLKNGHCAGEPFSCDDDDPATLDECAADGCVHRPAPAEEEPRT